MTKYSIDINCDLGEGMTNDALIMPYIDSCNIACGGHAGDIDSMSRTIGLAKEYGVKIGAHPSFEDRINFGRKALEVSSNELKSQLIRQISKLLELADEQEITLTHVKAHGALYNISAGNYNMGMLLIEVLTSFKEDLCIFVPYGSLLEKLVRERNLPFKTEVFADRNYNEELELMPRSHPHAVLNDIHQIKERVWQMISENKVVTFEGQEISIDFDTICVHGDHPKAVNICKALNELKTKDI